MTMDEQIQCANALMDELVDVSTMICLVSNGNEHVHAALTGPGSTYRKLLQALTGLID